MNGAEAVDLDAAIASETARWHLELGDGQALRGAVEMIRATYTRVEDLGARLAHLDTAEPRRPLRATYRIDDDDPYHAWMYRLSAETSPLGPLHGKSFAVKDCIAVAGVPLTLGGNFLRGFVPSRNAWVVERTLEAGGSLEGTAVCEDMCYSGSSFTSVTGPVRNPYDDTRAAGGSSSGSAVLVATGAVDFAFGTDLGGSVRNPAAWAGVCGLKPTFGLVPYDGAFRSEMTMDHIGILARNASDVADVLDVVADPTRVGLESMSTSYAAGLDRDLSDVRVAVVAEGFAWPGSSDPRVDELVRRSACALSELGMQLGDASIPLHRHAADIHVPISCEGALATVFEQNSQGSNHAGNYDAELAQAFGEAMWTNSSQLPLNAKIAVIAGSVLRAETRSHTLATAQNLRRHLRGEVDRALSDADVLVMPTIPMLAHPLPTEPLTPEAHNRLSFEMHGNNCAFNLTGNPAISVPCGLVDGLPVGMLLIARHLEDDLLLRVAHQFQKSVFPCPRPTARAHRGVVYS